MENSWHPFSSTPRYLLRSLSTAPNPLSASPPPLITRSTFLRFTSLHPLYTQFPFAPLSRVRHPDCHSRLCTIMKKTLSNFTEIFLTLRFHFHPLNHFPQPFKKKLQNSASSNLNFFYLVLNIKIKFSYFIYGNTTKLQKKFKDNFQFFALLVSNIKIVFSVYFIYRWLKKRTQFFKTDFNFFIALVLDLEIEFFFYLFYL